MQWHAHGGVIVFVKFEDFENILGAPWVKQH